MVAMYSSLGEHLGTTSKLWSLASRVSCALVRRVKERLTTHLALVLLSTVVLLVAAEDMVVVAAVMFDCKISCGHCSGCVHVVVGVWLATKTGIHISIVRLLWYMYAFCLSSSLSKFDLLSHFDFVVLGIPHSSDKGHSCRVSLLLIKFMSWL